MGYEKHNRPLTAPSFNPEPSGISLADLAQGTNGQLIVGQTGGGSLYKSITGDVTVTANGVCFGVRL